MTVYGFLNSIPDLNGNVYPYYPESSNGAKFFAVWEETPETVEIPLYGGAAETNKLVTVWVYQVITVTGTRRPSADPLRQLCVTLRTAAKLITEDTGGQRVRSVDIEVYPNAEYDSISRFNVAVMRLRTHLSSEN